MESHAVYGNPGRPRVAILDDDPGFCELAALVLHDAFDVTTLTREEQLWDLLAAEEPDALLLDIWLGDDPDAGFRVYERMRARGHFLPVIVLSMKTGLAVTSRAVALGLPFLQKDETLDAETFKQHVTQALRVHALQTEVLYHRRMSATRGEFARTPWADSPAGRRVLDDLRPHLGARTPLILFGELGTGKRTAAHWVQSQDPDSSLPVVEFSLRGLDPESFDAEIFGVVHETRREPGVLDAVGYGTVILLGLERALPATRTKLQAMLTTGTYRSEGESRVRRLRSRVIATFLVDTGETMDAARREFPGIGSVLLPALREHPEDLVFHAGYLARQLDLPESMATGRLTSDDLARLRSDPFPGNFHDLKAMVLRGAAAVRASREALGEEQTEARLWERLADRDWRYVEQHCIERYSRALERRLGRNPDAWMLHTGFSRATVYRRFFGCLDPDGGRQA